MKKRYDDDDGRTVADMSGVKRQPLWFPDLSGGRTEKSVTGGNGGSPVPEMTPKERRIYFLASLKASLLIGLAVIVGLGLIILVIYLLT